MIDLHSHVLPGIDDGAADFDASVKLAQAAAENGITRLAATPHLRHDFPGVVPAELARRTTMLRDALHGVGVSLDLVSGAEVDLVWADEADWGSGC